MKRCLPFVTLLFVFFASSLSAQPVLKPGKPADVGLSEATLRRGIGLFEKAVADDELRGAVILVARSGTIVAQEAVGWRNYDKKLPLETGTLFHVASNTKPVVATAILLLMEEGKIDLDAPVSRYLPSFANERSCAITVRHLLTHTSGFRIPTIFLTPLKEFDPASPLSRLQVEVNRFAEVGPAEKPGVTYSYSNPGYNTLGAIVEVVSRQPLESFLTERIYQPLGMKDAMHHDRKESVDRRSCIYSKKGGSWAITYQPGDPPLFPFVRGSGGLITTADDYAKFLQMYLNGGIYNGKRILKTESVQAATQPQTRSVYSPEQLKTQRQFYGFGWQIPSDGIYGHSGSDGTYAWVDPKNEIIGIVFTQSPNGRNPRNDFVQIVREAISPPK